MEAGLTHALKAAGATVVRAHPFIESKQHGFIDSQRYGMEVFQDIPSDAPLVIAEAVWQYSHHVLAGLTTHQGPILTVANWSGQWPGLVGLLNLNGSLAKAGVRYSSLWSEDFSDTFFLDGIAGMVAYRNGGSRFVPCSAFCSRRPESPNANGGAFAQSLKKKKAILGVFDEGCMGMFNAIVPDDLLHATGIFKERLSQSTLAHESSLIKDEEAKQAYEWLLQRGMQFISAPIRRRNSRSSRCLCS